jgi:hypothetical protein
LTSLATPAMGRVGAGGLGTKALAASVKKGATPAQGRRIQSACMLEEALSAESQESSAES